MTMEVFDLEMDARAAAEEANAAKAKAEGNERETSIALMKKSMYETMLRTLGHKAPGKLPNVASDFAKRAEAARQSGDEDIAERCDIQRECVEYVITLLNKEELA